MNTRSNGAPEQTRKRILVVDDEPVVLAVVESMLDHLGFDCLTVPDGSLAIDCCKKCIAAKRPFAAVIIDLKIPGGTGAREAVDPIHEVIPDLPVFISSGDPAHPVLDDPSRYGFAGVIHKPFDLDRLEIILQSVGAPK